MITTCVLREVAGIPQYVPAADVPFFNANERVFVGDFRHETENDGPSRSHKRTICLPTGKVTETVPCVLRDLGDGSGAQFVPVSEVPAVNHGERIFAGDFRGQSEKHGPYGSHKRTVCLPNGTPVEKRVA